MLYYFNLIFLYFFIISQTSGQVWASGKSQAPKLNFKEMRRQFKPAAVESFQNFKETLDTKLTKPMSTEILNHAIRRQFFHQFNICHDRFQRCSRLLAPAFCATPSSNIVFYLWARNLANDIMEGVKDGHTNVKCSPVLLQRFLKYDEINQDKRKYLSSIIGKLVE